MGQKSPKYVMHIPAIQESTICMSLFLSAFFFFFSNPIKKEGRRAKHSGILWQNTSHRLLTQLGLEKQPWDVLIPGLCSRGHMLQAEIMEWQGVTPCNVSLCCAMTAEGSMPVCDDSKGWNRSPREALEFPAQGWGRDKRVRVALACWSRLWFGEDATSSLEVPSRPHFLKLNLKPCNMTLWEQMRSSPQCQCVLNRSFKSAPISQLPGTAASSQCASSHNPDLGLSPVMHSLLYFPSRNLPYYLLFAFLSGKLQFLWCWNFSEMESIQRFLKYLTSKAVGINCLTQKVYLVQHLCWYQNQYMGEVGSMKHLWLFNCFFVSQSHSKSEHQT